MNWIRDARERADKFQTYVNDLEKRHEEVLKELELISIGATLTESPSNWELGWKLQDRAAKKLGSLAKRAKPTRPVSVF